VPDKRENYYDILGLGRNPSDEDIKDAFRRLAKECHPDANPGDREAERRFKEINEAYETLKDPVKRAAYDKINEKMTREQALEYAVHLAVQIQQNPSDPDPEFMRQLDDVIREYLFTDAELEDALDMKIEQLHVAKNIFGVADFIKRMIEKGSAEASLRVAAAEQKIKEALAEAQTANSRAELAKEREGEAYIAARAAKAELRSAHATIDGHEQRLGDLFALYAAAQREIGFMKGEPMPQQDDTPLGQALAQNADFRNAVAEFESPMAASREAVRNTLEIVVAFLNAMNSVLPEDQKIRFVHGLYQAKGLPVATAISGNTSKNVDPHQSAVGYIVYSKTGMLEHGRHDVLVFSILRDKDNASEEHVITPGIINDINQYYRLMAASSCFMDADLHSFGNVACASSSMRLPEISKALELKSAYGDGVGKSSGMQLNMFDGVSHPKINNRIAICFAKDLSWLPAILKNHFMRNTGTDTPAVRTAIARLATEPR
jgi:curved DNA-binding protein CbpA